MSESRINRFDGISTDTLKSVLEKREKRRDRASLAVTIFAAFAIVLEISLIWWAFAILLVSGEIDVPMMFKMLVITIVLLNLLIVLMKIDSALSVDREGLATEIDRRKKTSE
jgi:fatty acid desaturase